MRYLILLHLTTSKQFKSQCVNCQISVIKFTENHPKLTRTNVFYVNTTVATCVVSPIPETCFQSQSFRKRFLSLSSRNHGGILSGCDTAEARLRSEDPIERVRMVYVRIPCEGSSNLGHVRVLSGQ